jgi:hypothetical protein
MVYSAIPVKIYLRMTIPIPIPDENIFMFFFRVLPYSRRYPIDMLGEKKISLGLAWKKDLRKKFKKVRPVNTGLIKNLSIDSESPWKATLEWPYGILKIKIFQWVKMSEEAKSNQHWSNQKITYIFEKPLKNYARLTIWTSMNDNKPVFKKR